MSNERITHRVWLKLDDGFASHPKVLAAGAIPALIQVRAICYASQHRTDGFIPSSAVMLLLSGLEELGVDLGRAGELATFGCQANELDWAPKMVESGLWEVRPGGYYVHDYLDWNLSKSEYESFINKKRKAGKKGMRARWGKGSQELTPAITPAITDDITKRYHPTSTSTSSLNPLNVPNPKSKSRVQSEAEWMESLKRNVAYKHVDFANEWGKMDAWLATRPHRKKTKRFVVDWLNRIEPPLTRGNGGAPRPPPPPPKNDPIGRGIWGQTYGDPRKHGYD